MNVQFNLIRLVLISFGIFITSHLFSQNAPITTAGSVSVCPGGAISIPITVTNFNQITAISLQIDFNPILINYTGYANLNSAISSSFVNEVSVSPTLKKIMIVWSDVTPLNLTNGSKLLDLTFTLVSGTPVLTFNNTENGGGNCEYANASGDPLNDSPTATYYLNATVTNTGPGAAGTISGTSSVDQGQSGIAFSVPLISNATSYTWAYSGTGATIHGSTNNITIDFAADASSGNLSVYGTNTCGNGTSSSNYPITVNQVINKNISVKVFFEGPYTTNAMSTSLNENLLIPLSQPFNTAPWNYGGTESVATLLASVVDWVLVDLRDAATPETATTSITGWPKACFLKSDGSIVGLDGSSLPSIGNQAITNSLYVVVRHRNHIAVMSATGMVLASNTYSYDFTTGLGQAYGSGAGFKELETGVFGMVAGDADADGSVFASDFNSWALDFGNTSIYLDADIDMDGSVFASDFNKWAINFGTSNPVNMPSPGHFISQVPGLK